MEDAARPDATELLVSRLPKADFDRRALVRVSSFGLWNVSCFVLCSLQGNTSLSFFECLGWGCCARAETQMTGTCGEQVEQARGVTMLSKCRSVRAIQHLGLEGGRHSPREWLIVRLYFP